jgi:hypothetical protein
MLFCLKSNIEFNEGILFGSRIFQNPFFGSFVNSCLEGNVRMGSGSFQDDVPSGGPNRKRGFGFPEHGRTSFEHRSRFR